MPLRRNVLLAALLICTLAPSTIHAQEQDRWSIEPSLYLFLSGLTGSVGIGVIDIDMDSPSNAILHLNAVVMGSVRVGYGAWALTTDVLYADIGMSNEGVTGSVQELIVEPSISYRVFSWLEPLAGFRYDRFSGDFAGPFGHARALAQGWFDPILGAVVRLPLSQTTSLDFRADIGGFGVGSKLTWQLFPYVAWRAAKHFSMQAGFRVLSIDYEQGSGLERLKYDVIQIGPQFGMAFPFDL